MMIISMFVRQRDEKEADKIGKEKWNYSEDYYFRIIVFLTKESWVEAGIDLSDRLPPIVMKFAVFL